MILGNETASSFIAPLPNPDGFIHRSAGGDFAAALPQWHVGTGPRIQEMFRPETGQGRGA
jgi:hypothetical protein